MMNIFSIDLESWIHFYEDALKIPKFSSGERKQFDHGYIRVATNALLNLLARSRIEATFFVVGELYDWYPELIREIQKQGHEIAYHTHTHTLLRSRGIVERELSLSRNFIKDFRPKGFRAPQIYLPDDARRALAARGFTYSSSSYEEYIITSCEGVSEIPVSAFPFRQRLFSPALPKPLTFKLLLNKIPIGSGLSLALLGTQTSRFIRALNKQQKPAILFIHPWQLYQPLNISSLQFKLRLARRNPLCLPYTKNITSTVEKLFKAHPFTSFRRYFYGQQAVLG